MGINNKQRRANKRKKAAKTRSQSTGNQFEGYQYADLQHDESFDNSSDTDFISDSQNEDLASALWQNAAMAIASGTTHRAAIIIDKLVEGPISIVDSTAADALTEIISWLWERGWQPADVERVVRRQLRSPHVALLVDSIADGARVYDVDKLLPDPVWMSQLAEIDATRWWSEQHEHLSQWQRRHELSRNEALLITAETLCLLRQLPEIPILRTPPSGWKADGLHRTHRQTSNAAGDEVHAKMLQRVRALLAKAESTTFTEEAESLTEKAQQLMARYSIDRAMLQANEGSKISPDARRVAVDDPYAQCKSSLLHVVAQANNCKTVWSKAFGFVTVFGFSEDIEVVELLHTSLLIQATSAMVAHSTQTVGLGASHTRSFRQSFLYAFADRIGHRLAASKQTVVDEGEQTHGASLLPVLASRDKAVNDYFEELFPEIGSVRKSISNQAGWVAGRAAADAADLDIFDQIEK